MMIAYSDKNMYSMVTYFCGIPVSASATFKRDITYFCVHNVNKVLSQSQLVPQDEIKIKK